MSIYSLDDINSYQRELDDKIRNLEKTLKDVESERDSYRERLTHLCASPYIASFDELIPGTGRYKRNIVEAVGPAEDARSKEYPALKQKDLLVVRCNAYLKSGDYEGIYENLLNQKAIGTILLPNYMEAIVVPGDVELKLIEGEEKKNGINKTTTD